MTSLEAYADIFDHEITKRNNLTKSDLFQITALVKESKDGSFFTEKRTLGYLHVLKANLPTLSGPELLEAIKLPIRFDMKSSDLFIAWEKAVVNKISEVPAVGLLQAYLRLQADLPRQMFDTWCASSRAQTADWTTGQMATAIECLARLKLRPSDDFIDAYVDRLPQLEAVFEAEDLVRIIYAWGKLGYTSNKKLNKFVLAALAKYESYGLHETKAPVLVRLLEGLAKLNIKPPNDASGVMQKYWFETITEHLKQLDNRSLVGTAWSLKRLRIPVKNQNDFRQEWYTRVIPKMNTFGARELYITLQASEYLGFRSEEGMTHFVKTWTSKTSSQLNDFWSHELAQVLDVLNNLVANTVKGTSVISTQFREQWQQQCVTRMDDMYADDLVVILRSLVPYYEKSKGRLDEKLYQEWKRQMRKHIKDISRNMAISVKESHASMNLTMESDIKEIIAEKI